MSLRGKDFRGEIDADLHDKLRRMAEFQDVEVSSLGAQILEQAICYEWCKFEALLSRMKHLKSNGS